MPTTEGYNGAYTGQQIDAAIAKANAALLAPDGGTAGQILEKTESGTKWGDKPVMYVHVTESDGNYSADKTFEEIKEAYDANNIVIGLCKDSNDFLLSLPLIQISNGLGTKFAYFLAFDSLFNSVAIYIGDDETVTYDSMKIPAKEISFTPKYGLTTENVQDAIEELADQSPKSTTITLTSASWTANAQTVTVTGVKATGQNVRLSPVTKADADAWVSAGCWCTAQVENALTFTCETVPAQDIQLNVEMQEVQS